MSSAPLGRRLAFAGLALLTACFGSGSGNKPVAAASHTWFPITSGSHTLGRALSQGTLTCDSCHDAQSNSFTDFTCTSCHEHAQTSTDPLHLSAAGYAYGATSCYACHTKSVPYDHFGITGNCASCHDVGASFAALPVAGFTHQTISSDCGSCHNTVAWNKATGAPADAFDPSKNVVLTSQIPSYAGTSIVQLTAQQQTLQMTMNHGSSQVPADTMSACAACHPNAATQTYFPGVLHASLAAQPTGCSSCHAAAAPPGFVGPAPLSPRNPASPEMKHDAVAWASGSPTTSALVQQDCSVCHAPPTAASATPWAHGVDGSSPATFHPALTSASKPQPTTCLDCHANSRPVAALASPGASLPAGLQLDHQQTAFMGDCAACHASGGATQWTSWAGGRFHAAGSSTPASCLSCHEGERPSATVNPTSSWQSAPSSTAPFDFTGDSQGGFNHGDSRDCADCHTGPGTGGAWGGTQTWVGGSFDHAARQPSSCLACHLTQRPTQPVGSPQSFDHATAGNGDCVGCHQATVTQASYVSLKDWQGGQTYPGISLVASPGQFISVTTLALSRNASNLVTGMTSSSVTLNNAMLHTSAALPAALNAGTTPDSSKCWHCHTHAAGSTTVADYTNGKLHASFDNFQATLGAAVTPQAQPTSCLDCHSQMRPPNVVERSASDLLPIDHSAAFAATATIGGKSVTSVSQLDCGTCHATPGSNWSDGQFHAKINSATPADCVACHYPLMADAASADVASATNYAMKHRSTRLTIQACQTCHAQALGEATTQPAAASLWKTGALHASLSTQPSACNDCHTATEPTPRTQSSVTYAFAEGGTSTNGGQWMSHGASPVAGKDCVACHASDATKTSWSKSTAFHAAASGVTACSTCHGGGSSPGRATTSPPASPTRRRSPPRARRPRTPTTR